MKQQRRMDRRRTGRCVVCADAPAVVGVRCVRHAAMTVWRNSHLAAERKGHKAVHLSQDDFVVWYVQRWNRADGCCEWCGEKFGDRVVMDHDHETGAPRALVCNSCNMIEGYIKGYGVERIERVINALKVYERV